MILRFSTKRPCCVWNLGKKAEQILHQMQGWIGSTVDLPDHLLEVVEESQVQAVSAQNMWQFSEPGLESFYLACLSRPGPTTPHPGLKREKTPGLLPKLPLGRLLLIWICVPARLPSHGCRLPYNSGRVSQSTRDDREWKQPGLSPARPGTAKSW